MSLAGKVAVVSGAAGGIGAATTRHLAGEGCAVILLDVDVEGCERVAAECENALALGCDISDPAQVDHAVAVTLERHQRCDILVNNAAVIEWAPLRDVTIESWDRVMSVDARGYFLCTQGFGRTMLERRSGSIINITSVAATFPETGAGAYSPAKAACAMLTRLTAVEWGPFGVRCNAVSPSLIRSPMSERFWRQPGVEERRLAIIPQRRAGTPSDVATVIAFLAGDDAGFVNGQTLEVDGGWMQTLIQQLPRPGAPAADQPAGAGAAPAAAVRS